jgi:hypothetical protein
MQSKRTFATIAIESLEEQTHIILNNEQTSSLPGRERYEVGSGRRNQSSGLQEQTSAAKAATLPSLNWHDWNSCPSRCDFVLRSLVLGRLRRCLVEPGLKTKALLLQSLSKDQDRERIDL